MREEDKFLRFKPTVVKSSLKTNTFSDEYLILDYLVMTDQYVLKSSTSVINLYNAETGVLLSSAPIKVTSNTPMPLLSLTPSFWVGDAKKVTVTMVSCSVTCSDGVTYPLVPYQSYTAKR